MIVFNSYFKIVKRYKPIIIIYTAIFLFFAILGTSSNQTSVASFGAVKPNVALINNDSNTSLISSFKEYLNENAKIIDLKNETDSIKDALFFRTVDYIIVIPSNFTNDFFNNKESKIDTLKVPNSYQATYTEMLLNNFLNAARIYSLSNISENEIGKYVLLDLKEKANVILETTSKNINILDNARYYFNFCNYTLLGLIILIVGMTLGSFRDFKIKRRNLVSPISLSKINKELTLGNLVLAASIWLIYVIFSFILYFKVMITLNGLLFIINSFIFMISALSMGFLFGNITNSKEANSSIANIVALGSSFLCGAFVPQSMLGSSVLNFAHILPSYWFIKNNDTIASINIFNQSNLTPIIINMIVLLIFAAVFYIVMQIITKLKLKEN